MASGRGKSSLATDLKSYLDSLTSWKHSATAKPRPNQRKKINLALQGGGAHGAFTWGVLDHLLEHFLADLNRRGIPKGLEF
jgi:NTE family protein